MSFLSSGVKGLKGNLLGKVVRIGGTIVFHLSKP